MHGSRATEVLGSAVSDLTEADVQGAFSNLTVVRSFTPGGQGSAYLVRDSNRGDSVLKVIWPEFRERALREFTALGRIASPFLAKVYDFGDCPIGGDDYVFMLSELIEGDDMRAMLAAQGRLDEDEVTSMLGDVSEALEALWAERIVHRDVTPSNIIIQPNGRAALIDLGVARHLTLATITSTGATWGKQGYMAPEHALAQRAITVRADIFSLGVTGYEAVTGRHPFSGRQSVITAGIAPPSPADLGAASRDASDMIMSMLEFRAALRPLPRQVLAALGR